MEHRIKTITARQILDCKARPMVEVDVITEDGCLGRGSAPTGTSVGMYESFVLRDNDPNDYGGLSVHKAVELVKTVLAPALTGMDVMDQRKLDETMIALDGTPDKSCLGGNTIYSVSIACLRAAAAVRKVPVYRLLAGKPLEIIPLPTFNIMNGGRNAGVTQPFNEFIIVPYKAEDVNEAVSMAIRVFQQLKKRVSQYLGGKEPCIGGSYGWAAPSNDPAVVLQLIAEAVDDCGLTGRIAYALDCASSEMYDAKTDTYELSGQRVGREEIIRCVKSLTERYPFFFVEDILDENDWDGFAQAHREITRTNLIGDDLIVTNPERLKMACERQAIDGFILKPNQIGTITEALDAYAFGRENGLFAIPSGRSGGAVDDVVADICLALQGAISKNGAPRSGERLNKINSLLRAFDENPGSHLADFSGLIRF